jgi:gliding motility-associated-like protein
MPNISFDATPHEGCEDLDVTMINSATGAVGYLWEFGDGTQSTATAPSHTYKVPGMYDVSLVATTADGCIDTLTTVDLIGVWQMPFADFYYTPEIQDIYSPTFQFYDMSGFADEYLWQFGDGTQYILPNPEHTYEEAGLYPVTLTVRTNHGCTSTKIGSVTVEDIFQVYVPNTFTPDGDGINEVFLPKMTGLEFIEHYLFRIVDRWGTVIFETEDPKEAWVGDVRDGEYFAKDEGYNWYVIVQLIGVDEDRVYKGHVILVR